MITGAIKIGDVFLFRERHERIEAPAPAPAPSQHPADLKPRGVKAPLYLIPWGAVPPACVPAPIEAAARNAGTWPDRCEYRPAIERGTFPEELIESLIKTGGVTFDQIAEVFAYGARKYARDNWRAFAWDRSAQDEYFGAICRHLCADAADQALDPESGLSHRAHAATGALIWAWHLIYGSSNPARPPAGERPDV